MLIKRKSLLIMICFLLMAFLGKATYAKDSAEVVPLDDDIFAKLRQCCYAVLGEEVDSGYHSGDSAHTFECPEDYVTIKVRKKQIGAGDSGVVNTSCAKLVTGCQFIPADRKDIYLSICVERDEAGNCSTYEDRRALCTSKHGWR